MNIDRNEIRRLEKAVKDKNSKVEIGKWIRNFDLRLNEEYKKVYDKKYREDLLEAIDTLILTIAYVLRFSDETKLSKKKVRGFVEDLKVTTNMFMTGEYNVEDYKRQLEEEGIVVFENNGGENE